LHCANQFFVALGRDRVYNVYTAITIPNQKGVSAVQAVRAVYDGRAFVPVRPVNAEKNQAAIITILDEVQSAGNGKSYVKYAGRLSDERRAELEEILESTRGVANTRLYDTGERSVDRRRGAR
jgi:hypothetical protein